MGAQRRAELQHECLAEAHADRPARRVARAIAAQTGEARGARVGEVELHLFRPRLSSERFQPIRGNFRSTALPLDTPGQIDPFCVEPHRPSGYLTLMQLNTPQQQAVAHVQGPLLVFAGAGSGKTRVITYRIANLLAQYNVPPYRILAVTFTNKAAAEMKERLIALGSEELVRDLWVGTFHSVCCRMLRRYHSEVGLQRSFTIYDDGDQKALMARIIRNEGLDERLYQPKAVLAKIHRQKQEGVAPGDVKLEVSDDETWLELYHLYERALLTSNAVDFDDLILHVLRIAESDSIAARELRDRFDYVLVDEFQDTNAIQYRLIRALSARGNLCVVGDDDQSIYSWRGADIRNIREFKRDFPGASVVKLEQNYRSTGRIVRAALGVISRSLSREPKELWTQAEPGGRVLLCGTTDERAEAGFVVENVQRELRDGTSPEQIAIFYRINAQSRVLEEAFRGARIPYQVIGGMRFFERAEIKDIISYLRLIENPLSDGDLVRVINTPARGIGSKTLERVLVTAHRGAQSAFVALQDVIRDSSLGAGPRKKLAAFLELMLTLRSKSGDMTPAELAREVITRTGYRKTLQQADTPEADARLENLEEFIGSLEEYEADAEAAGEEPSLAGYLERVSLVADIDSSEDVGAVSMMTVHSSKGLEFDSVYITGMEEKVFPYRGIDGEAPEELEEERRLAYVAITRARKRLVITHAGTRTLFGQTRYQQPSRFLANIPDDVAEITGRSLSNTSPVVAYGGFGAYARGTHDKQGTYGSRPSGYANGGYRKARTYDDFDQSPPSDAATYTREGTAPSAARVIDYEAFSDVPNDEWDAGHVDWKRGTRVLHQRFGRGTVQSVLAGDVPKIIAVFSGWGEKKVLATSLRRG